MKLYTTSQLAQICGYKDDAVIRKMIHSKKVTASKLGKIWIISEKDVVKNNNLKKRFYAKTI